MATLTAQHINQLKNIVGESFVFFDEENKRLNA